MTASQETSKTMNFTLWVAQILLTGLLVWAGLMKLLLPIEKLSAKFPWTGQVPLFLVKFTGMIDLLGAIGLILPSLLRIQPKLTPFAASGLIILMICASVFHISRGEASGIGLNIVFGFIALFVAWGRFKKSPITAK